MKLLHPFKSGDATDMSKLLINYLLDTCMYLFLQGKPMWMKYVQDVGGTWLAVSRQHTPDPRKRGCPRPFHKRHSTSERGGYHKSHLTKYIAYIGPNNIDSFFLFVFLFSAVELLGAAARALWKLSLTGRYLTVGF